MASIVTPITYPRQAQDFFVFTVVVAQSAGLGTVRVQVDNPFTGVATDVAAYSAGALASDFVAGGSTVTGSGTMAIPYRFSLRPSAGWVTTGNRPHQIALSFDDTAAAPSIPSGWETRTPYREYDTLWVQTMAHLVAHPAVRSNARTRWPNLEAMVILTELKAVNLANYASAKANAALLSPPMRIFPGYRVMAHHQVGVDPTGFTIPVFSDWVDPVRWQAMANLWRDYVIPLCSPDDPRVYISAENYGASGAEPTVDALAASGYTEQQFFDACEPFVQLMASSSRVCCVAPMAFGGSNNMHLLAKRLIQVCGAEWVHMIWETVADYRIPNDYREKTGTESNADVISGSLEPNKFDLTLGIRGVHRRACSDDILREHGALAEANVIGSGSWGPYAPWVESVTDADLANYGNPSMVNSTTLDSTNDVYRNWRIPPMYATTSLVPKSVGSGTSVVLEIYRSSVQTSIGSAGGGQQFNDYDGWRISPQAPNIYAAWRGDLLPPSGNAAQYTWTVVARFKIPASLAANMPLFGQAEANIGTWQVYYDSAADAIKIQCAGGAVSTIMSAPARDTLLHIMVARASATSFKHAYRGSTVTTFAAASSTAYPYVVFGGGQEVATFPTDNKIQSCNNFVGQELGCWWRTLTDVEMARHLNGQYPLGIFRL